MAQFVVMVDFEGADARGGRLALDAGALIDDANYKVAALAAQGLVTVPFVSEMVGPLAIYANYKAGHRHPETGLYLNQLFLANAVPGYGGGGGGGGAPEWSLNWRSGTDGEYYGNGDTAIAAFGDQIMFDPRKAAGGGGPQTSVVGVTLPEITAADYGKQIRAICQYDSETLEVNYGNYARGLAGKIRFNPFGNDLIGDTDDYYAFYPYPPYVDWIAGFLTDASNGELNRQGPYSVTLTALPPDDNAVYSSGRWTAEIAPLTMAVKGPGQDPSGTLVNPGPTTLLPGNRQRMINTGAGNINITSAASPRTGDKFWGYVFSATGTITFLRNGNTINAQASDDVISSVAVGSGITPLGGKKYEFIGAGVGWLITDAMF